MVIDPTKAKCCPSCGSAVQKMLILGFWYCSDCEIAFRNEEDMPEFSYAYDNSWAVRQEKCKDNFLRAANALRLIKKYFAGVRSVMDIGCGTGILVDFLSTHGFEALGVDSSTAVIDFAKATKRGQFLLDSSNLWDSSQPMTYDLVTALQLVEHLRDPVPFLKNVKAVLTKGGFLYIETPNIRCYSRHSLWRNRFCGIVGAPDHRVLYSPKSLRALVEAHGFQICSIETRTYPPTLFVDLYKTLRKSVTRWFGRKGGTTDLTNAVPHRGVGDSQVSLAKYGVLKKARAIRDRFTNSAFLSALLFLPNRISELSQRGVQLVIIARLDEGKSN